MIENTIIENQEEILEAPMGAILGTIIELIEEENLKGAEMIIMFLNDESTGYQFRLSCDPVKPKKKSLLDRLFGR